MSSLHGYGTFLCPRTSDSLAGRSVVVAISVTCCDGTRCVGIVYELEVQRGRWRGLDKRNAREAKLSKVLILVAKGISEFCIAQAVMARIIQVWLAGWSGRSFMMMVVVLSFIRITCCGVINKLMLSPFNLANMPPDLLYILEK